MGAEDPSGPSQPVLGQLQESGINPGASTALLSLGTACKKKISKSARFSCLPAAGPSLASCELGVQPGGPVSYPLGPGARPTVLNTLHTL